MSEREWRTSNLIEAYWLVERDESLKMGGGTLPPATQAQWYQYKLGALGSAAPFLPYDYAGQWWDQP